MGCCHCIQVETSIEIDAPVDKVWAALYDTASWPKWNPTFVSMVEQKSNEAKPPAVGQALFLTAHSTGPAKVIKGTPSWIVVDEKKELRFLGHQVCTGCVDANHWFILEKVSDTRTRFINGEYFGGCFPTCCLCMHCLKPTLHTDFTNMNVALKKLCEAPPASSV